MLSAMHPLLARRGDLKPEVMYRGASSTVRCTGAGALPPTTPPTTPVPSPSPYSYSSSGSFGSGGLISSWTSFGWIIAIAGTVFVTFGLSEGGRFWAGGGGGAGGFGGAAALTNFTSTTGSDFTAAR